MPATAWGQPLRFEQNPPLLRADDLNGLSLDNLLFAGDVESLEFRLWKGGGPVRETWTRVGTTTIAGRPVSIFNPSWNAADLSEIYRWKHRHSSAFYFGDLVLPTGEVRGFTLRSARLNLPPSRVERIDATAQYASHVVNLVVPHFGNAQMDGGLEIEDVTRRFYEHFPDGYDSIVLVPAETTLMRAAGFHITVRNPIAGLGTAIFDDSARYGSSGKLRAVEVYRHIGSLDLRIHEMGHHWVDFWDWSALTGGFEMRDRSHTPLLFPGTTFTARRPSFMRVVEDGSGGFVVESTPVLDRRLHPTTLYRMGVIEPDAVPEMLVFEDQRRPDVGDAVEGGYRRVRISDIVARHGPRSGPVDSTWRTATVVVSRDRLLPREEMSYWNFLAARHEAEADVPGDTTYHEATHSLVRLHTDVTPTSAAKVRNDPPLPASLPIDPREFPGVQLDAPVPAFITVGEPVTLSGTVTTTERDDFREACFLFRPNGVGTTPLACSPIVDGRFFIPLEFSYTEAGDYSLMLRLQYPGGLTPLSTIGSIRIVAGGDVTGTNRPPTAIETLADQTLVAGGVLDVDVSQAFADPDGDDLIYTVSSTAPDVATAGATGATVTLTAVGVGTAVVQVTATDPGGLNATQSFTVAVTTAGARFTDDPLRPGLTPVRAVHFMELRERIDDLREAAGLGRQRWTDPVLRAGTTQVRLVHLQELRSALAAAYEAAGRPVPRWTDPAPVAGTTPIRAVHLTELRDAVLALE